MSEVTTTLPEWLVRDLERWQRERRTGQVAVRFRDGEVHAIEEGPEIKKPPLLTDVHLPCRRCGVMAEVFDMGRRVGCPACGLVQTDVEYRSHGPVRALTSMGNIRA